MLTKTLKQHHHLTILKDTENLSNPQKVANSSFDPNQVLQYHCNQFPSIKSVVLVNKVWKYSLWAVSGEESIDET